MLCAVAHTRRAVLVAVLAGLGASALGLEARADPQLPTIVVLRRGDDAEREITALERKHGFKADHRYVASVHGFAARLSVSQREAVRREANVSTVHDDRAVRLAPPVAGPLGAGIPTGVRRVGGGAEAASVAVAVIDTGIDLRHRALNMDHGVNCVAGQRRYRAQDENGHGTHVGGTIGARGSSGVVGVAPGTKLFAVKVLDANGGGIAAQAICGIDWVTANARRLGIAVADLSFGGIRTGSGGCDEDDDPLHEAICRSIEAGVTYVVAAGNDGADFASYAPAAYPEVLTVTAMSDSDGLPGGRGGAPACMRGERDDTPATFSNFATRSRDAAHVIAAPGVCITSTWPGGDTRTISGTSMAAPHVTGAVALCISRSRCGDDPASANAAVLDAAQRARSASGFVGDVRGRRYGDLVQTRP